MKITESLLTPNPYSRRQKSNNPKKIIIHYVGNPGSTAMGNRNYFESLKKGVLQSNGKYRYASSQYIIDLNGDILRCIPENEEAIHASDSELNVSSIGSSSSVASQHASRSMRPTSSPPSPFTTPQPPFIWRKA